MDRNQPQLAVFKYKHGDRVSLSGKRKLFFIASLVLALALAKLLFPFGLLALIIPLLAFFGGAKTLNIGPRYLVCGGQIVYYANVTHLQLSEAEGILSLQTSGGKSFAIEREKFPTNARKANKVAANKAAKFNKVTAKIIDKVRRASPVPAGVPGTAA